MCAVNRFVDSARTVRPVLPRDLGPPHTIGVCGPVAGFRTRERFSTSQSGVSTDRRFPGLLAQCFVRPRCRFRRSFSLTAAGQSRIRTGFPLASFTRVVASHANRVNEPPALIMLVHRGEKPKHLIG